MSRLEWWHLLLSGSEGPDFQAGSRMSGGSGTARCLGWRGRMSRAWELFSVFFHRRFHASLMDGVVVPWRLHSSSTSVKLQQYLCMHTGDDRG